MFDCQIVSCVVIAVVVHVIGVARIAYLLFPSSYVITFILFFGVPICLSSRCAPSSLASSRSASLVSPLSSSVPFLRLLFLTCLWLFPCILILFFVRYLAFLSSLSSCLIVSSFVICFCFDIISCSLLLWFGFVSALKGGSVCFWLRFRCYWWLHAHVVWCARLGRVRVTSSISSQSKCYKYR